MDENVNWKELKKSIVAEIKSMRSKETLTKEDTNKAILLGVKHTMIELMLMLGEEYSCLSNEGE